MTGRASASECIVVAKIDRRSIGQNDPRRSDQGPEGEDESARCSVRVDPGEAPSAVQAEGSSDEGIHDDVDALICGHGSLVSVASDHNFRSARRRFGANDFGRL